MKQLNGSLGNYNPFYSAILFLKLTEELYEKSPYCCSLPNDISRVHFCRVAVFKRKMTIWDFCPKIYLMLSSAYSSKKDREAFKLCIFVSDVLQLQNHLWGLNYSPKVLCVGPHMIRNIHGKCGAWWLGIFLVSPILSCKVKLSILVVTTGWMKLHSWIYFRKIILIRRSEINWISNYPTLRWSWKNTFKVNL